MSPSKTFLQKIAVRKNLVEAWEAVNKKAKNSTNPKVINDFQSFSTNLNKHIRELQKELLDESFSFSQAQRIFIPKANGKKRELIIPIVRDRVVQKAIEQVIKKKLLRKFQLKNEASYAYIKEKGPQAAIAKMLELYSQGYKYIFESDIIDFFGSVNVANCIEKVLCGLEDRSIEQLLTSAVDMEISSDGNPDNDEYILPERTTGLPQGGYLSPLLSNVYLSDFDHEMMKLGYRLIRYADDFLVMCKTKEDAENAYMNAESILSDLSLLLHPRNDNDSGSKTRIVLVTQKPISFLGAKFNGNRIYLDGKNRSKFSMVLGERINQSKDVANLLKSTNNLVQGWVAAYCHLDLTQQDIRKIDEEINKKIYGKFKKFGWKLQGNKFTSDHRHHSGVVFAENHLLKIRRNLKDLDLFEKFWM